MLLEEMLLEKLNQALENEKKLRDHIEYLNKQIYELKKNRKRQDGYHLSMLRACQKRLVCQRSELYELNKLQKKWQDGMYQLYKANKFLDELGAVKGNNLEDRIKSLVNQELLVIKDIVE